MFKFCFLIVAVAASSPLLQVGVLAATARTRIERFAELLTEIPEKMTRQRTRLELKLEAVDRFNCSVLPRNQVFGKEFQHALIAAMSPETAGIWHTFTDSKKEIICNALIFSIENTRTMLAREEKSLSRIQSLRQSYMELEVALFHMKDEITPAITELLTAGEAFERYHKICQNLSLALIAFRKDRIGSKPVGSLSWPVADSESLLRDIIAQVIAEGSGEDKVDLFMRKLDASKFIPRHEISKMLQDILEEYKMQLKHLGDTLLNLESAIFPYA